MLKVVSNYESECLHSAEGVRRFVLDFVWVLDFSFLDQLRNCLVVLHVSSSHFLADWVRFQSRSVLLLFKL